jgi:hypothetical protein
MSHHARLGLVEYGLPFLIRATSPMPTPNLSAISRFDSIIAPLAAIS